MRSTRFFSILLTLLLSLSLGSNSASAISSSTESPGSTGSASESTVQSGPKEPGNSNEPLGGVIPEANAVVGTPDKAPGQRDVLLQISNSYAVKSGETIQLKSGAGSPLTPYYSGSFSMVPLRIIAEAFGCTVKWDGSTQGVTVTKDTLTINLTIGSSEALVNGKATDLKAPVEIAGDSVYVPVRVFCQSIGCYIHYYSRENGEFLLLSDYPVSAGDRSGTRNADFDVSAPDPKLLAFKNIGVDQLGPSRCMYEQRTMTLKCGTTHAIFGGYDTIIEAQGARDVAPIQMSDGSVFVPLDYCAASFGAQVGSTSEGVPVMTVGGTTTIMPLSSGYSAQNETFTTLKFDGVIYTNIQAIARASGLYCTNLDDQTWVLSGYDISRYGQLGSFAEEDALWLSNLPSISGYIALTFDDGPSGSITTRLLDGLSERSVHATFFLCNYRIHDNSDLLPRYISDGHEIGNHSATHSDMTKESVGTIDSELDSTSASVLDYAGVTPALFRAPGGAVNQRLLRELDDRAMSCILWSVDPKDWSYRDTQVVVNKILSVAKDGDIILLHDLYNSSVSAGLIVIDALQNEGYKFLTVSDLAFIKGYTLSPGKIYYSLR